MKNKRERRIAMLLAMMMLVMNLIVSPVWAEPGDVAINEANFPDVNFRKIVKTFDKDSNRILSKSELDAVTSINARDKKIKNLKGIEYFTSLNWLDCSVNQLKALDVSKNINLKTLYCGQNQLTTLDVSKNKNLETLFCGLNQLTTLDLTNNTKLREFSCSENQLTTLDVSKNKNLETLYCDKNPLTTLDLSKNAQLIKINCIADQLSALDVSNNINLENLFCDHNQLTTLNLSKNAQLIKFDCTYNQLSALDVSNNINLETLSCDQNQLTTLDLNKNTKLKTLKCRDNQLVALDLSKNIDLETLSCDQNRLAALDLTENIDIVNFTGSNQECFVTLSEGSTSLDLKTLAAGFDPLKMSDLVGGTKSGNTLSLNDKPDVVTYKYEASTDNKLEVTLKIIYGEAVTVTYDWNNGSPIHSEKVPKGKEIPLKYPNFPAPDGKVFDYWEVNGDKKEAGETITVNVDTTIKAMWKVFEEIDINEENFPDAIFRNYISSTFDIDHSEKLSSEELAVTNIVVNGKNIESLKGIEYFTGLRVLNCEYNQLTTLDLSRNINLTTLYCQHNQLEALDLTNNTKLQTLECGYNQLAALDLTNNTAVTRLLGRGQERYVTVSESSKSLDLKTLADGFNPEKMSDLVGGSKSGNNLILNDDMPTTVTYEYNVKPSLSTLSVKLNVEYKKMVTITFNKNGHGTAPADITVNKGETATAPAAPIDDNYDFGGWYTEAECTNVFDFSQAVNDNITLYAKWTKKTPSTQYTLTASVDGGHGTVSPTTKTVNKDETVTLTFAPEANYEIEEVKVNGTATTVSGNSLVITMNEDKTVVVKYKEKAPEPPTQYTLTASVNGGHGSVSPTNETKNAGDTVTLTFAPDPGYEIDEVKVNDTVTGVMSNVLDITMNENKTVVVTFKPTGTPPTPVPVTITFDKNGGNGTMADVTKNKGESFTLPACTFTPPAGKEFKAWQVDGTEKNVGDNIEVNGDINIKAVWKDIGSVPPTPPVPPTPYTPYPWIVYPGWYYNFEAPKPKEEKPVTKMEMDWKIEFAIGTSTIDREINGVDSKIKMDVAPYIRDGRTMLPLRSLAEALGFEVEWNRSTRTVVLKDNNTRVEIPVGTNKIIVNGNVYTSDVKPEIKNNRTMLPIANLARALGLSDGKDIIWNSKSKMVTIYRSIVVK